MKKNNTFKGYCQTPLGRLLVTVSDTAVLSVQFAGDEEPAGQGGSSPLLEAVITQLEEYFQGRRQAFELPLGLGQGTAFQEQVWRTLTEIPFGETRSYGQLASSLGSKGSARAVGVACSRNPFLLLVPCHRVLGSDGSLTGFAAGVERKKWLLEHETPQPDTEKRKH